MILRNVNTGQFEVYDIVNNQITTANSLGTVGLDWSVGAAQYSCRREPCSGRSAWPHPGKACPSAWIEHRSGEQRSP
jgi:hypothetical protein